MLQRYYEVDARGGRSRKGAWIEIIQPALSILLVLTSLP